MDPVEIAHSITTEAIRAGVNRPDEIMTLFKTIVAEARASAAAPPPPPVVGEEDRLEPEEEAATVRPEPAAEPEPVVEPVAEAPLPSQAWREPDRSDEEPVSAHLSPEDIAASHGEDFIKCLECGQTKQQIKGHLRQMHKMTVEEYKAKWGLPEDYPTVAPATRRAFQERGRRNYEQARAAGKGLPAHPYRGPKKEKVAATG